MFLLTSAEGGCFPKVATSSCRRSLNLTPAEGGTLSKSCFKPLQKVILNVQNPCRRGSPCRRVFFQAPAEGDFKCSKHLQKGITLQKGVFQAPAEGECFFQKGLAEGCFFKSLQKG